ncbi:hypothetical protein AGDE_11002 [Angomonas deanei]|uniref:Uncharacterized protein n=1 Tax=Angomonas deanei TaxID=59799 RepID=A0A7G2C7V5_9TRYP|nr:hypothetical protein AGDE_11002 [Angomonas deanei]CAD2215826.1 hypothetical protein, conserved [Angomonas deanei]|eukprot:EPY26967.1 hypothetical protein AGDE_11002 [Angomonas deanei]
MPRDPKGAFCNLHLADHKCYQEFSCNQLHLHEAGPVRHRMNFFQKLAEIFVKEKVPRSEVVNRVKDSIFFARYGNKVTVKFHGTWVPFFKTLYTDGRLEQAFRQQHYSCNDYSCKNEHCKGIHCQDKKLPPHGKPMDLHNSPLIASELAEEADHIVSAVENTVMTPLSTPLISQLPTQDLWKATVRDYVRQSGIPQVEADETLLKTLQDVKISGTPLSSTSDRMTPIFDYPDLNGFN